MKSSLQLVGWISCLITVIAAFYFLCTGLGIISIFALFSNTHNLYTGCNNDMIYCNNTGNIFTCSYDTNCTVLYNGLICSLRDNSIDLWLGCHIVGMLTLISLFIIVWIIGCTGLGICICVKNKYKGDQEITDNKKSTTKDKVETIEVNNNNEYSDISLDNMEKDPSMKDNIMINLE